MKKLIQNQKEVFINQLLELLKIPSISADPQYKDEVKKTAEWIKNALNDIGCTTVKIYETEGHPVVYGEILVSESAPTVLVYGHYDVQPPDPLELWDSPPFEPIIKKTDLHPNGAIFARGACDDKGQMFMHLKAIELLVKNKSLNSNVKFVIEGEEEVGSDHLEKFITDHKSMLQSDIILISDTGINSIQNPAITTGLRGLSYMEVTVIGPNRDLHSGLYGGTVANPINVLCDMIASLHDQNRKVNISGFYDQVVEISEQELQKMNENGIDEKSFKDSIGIDAVMGEKGYTTLDRRSIRPTLDVNGIWGGYTGEGAKTVIPNKAHAKISMRLVPDQNWKDISVLFEKHFKAIAPAGVKVEVTTHHGGGSYVTPTDSVAYKAAEKAYQQVFGVVPHAKRDGGSIPIVPMFEKVLGSKTLLMGFGFDSDAIHSPNEHYGIDNFLKGIETIALFYPHFTALQKQLKP
ncbi:MAG: dipeptidase [Flavobacteriaceae bacterium]|jgi:acetylornithine deacetylase/succinyl-diaminopimelate desuccinylase-like protein|nr:dipeptidase [Flavobacteriaceae bacterium]